MPGKQQKTGPNSPVRYPSRPVQPALKPILERFDFVKSSRFSAFFPSQHDPTKNRRKKMGQGCRHRQTPPPHLPGRPEKRVEEQPERHHQREIILPHASDSCCAIFCAASACSSQGQVSAFPPPPPAGISPDTPATAAPRRYPSPSLFSAAPCTLPPAAAAKTARTGKAAPAFPP